MGKWAFAGILSLKVLRHYIECCLIRWPTSCQSHTVQPPRVEIHPHLPPTSRGLWRLGSLHRPVAKHSDVTLANWILVLHSYKILLIRLVYKLYYINWLYIITFRLVNFFNVTIIIINTVFWSWDLPTPTIVFINFIMTLFVITLTYL